MQAALQPISTPAPPFYVLSGLVNDISVVTDACSVVYERISLPVLGFHVGMWMNEAILPNIT